MPGHALSVKFTARYKGYQPRPSTRSLSRGPSGGGPPIGLFPARRWLGFLKVTSSTDLASLRPSRPITARFSHQPKLGNMPKEWESNWSIQHPTTPSPTGRPRQATR
ncbi:unnamed protein product [Prunus brigantina]